MSGLLFHFYEVKAIRAYPFNPRHLCSKFLRSKITNNHEYKNNLRRHKNYPG